MTEESRSQVYLESAPDGILVADLDGVIEYVSRQGIVLLGGGDTEDLIGKNLAEFVDPHDVARLNEVLRAEHHGPCELRIRRTNGASVWVEVNAEKISDAHAEGSVVLVARDASQRKQVEDELHSAMAAAEAVSQRLQKAMRELEQLASTDKLTGMWNRRHFEQVAGVEIARARRYSHIVSLVLLDVDHFKKVNDTYGHDTGDRVLVALARTISETVRNSDIACRWGGEEFVVLVPAVGAVGAARLANRIRERMEQLVIPEISGVVTVSAGVAQLEPNEELVAWLKRADQGLYRAKEQGRNRVEVSSSSGDTPEHRVVQVVWDPEYECGNPVIDEQHRQLFHLANALMDESMAGAPVATQRERLSALLAHVITHFSDEERILAQIGYDGLERHAKQHAALAHEMLRMGARLESGDMELQELVMFLVVRVVHDHLLHSDTKFFPALAAAREQEGASSHDG